MTFSTQFPTPVGRLTLEGDDRRIYLWPNSASVTTVMWYRATLFRRLGLGREPGEGQGPESARGTGQQFTAGDR